MTEEIKNTQPVNDDEIDLVALVKTTWNARRFIIKTVIVFAFIGLAVALLSPKEYTASTTMVPQLSENSSNMGGLSSLAAMAGFNIDMNKGSAELSPYIYPQIVQSVPFQLEIMNTAFTFSDVEEPVTLYEYYTECSKPGVLSKIKEYTIGLPGVIISAIKGKPQEVSYPADSTNTIHLTQEQEGVRKTLAASLTLETNDAEGYLVLNAVFHEALLAAQVTQKAQELLQQYITVFRIEKAKAQLEFIQERYKENKRDFEKSQAALAEFRDKNKNVTSARARTREEQLQSEYQLAFEVYSQLAQQLEQARIKVEEDTPVFAVIKPVTVPLERSKPNRKMILVIWTFLGGVAAIGWVFGKQFISGMKERWREEEA